MNQLQRTLHAIVWSPILWGSLATACFYVPLHLGYWHSEFLTRYFASHVIEHVATLLFAIGVAALGLKYLNIGMQSEILDHALLDPPSGTAQSGPHAAAMLQRLAALPFGWQQSYLVRRLREALEFVVRRGNADKLEEELHYLSELDVARMHATYSLPRIIIWAIPILGLLGTVIGITRAVANLSPQSLESSIAEVTSGLGVAFDHTALALGLSMGLMFTQYFVERRENQLLSEVEHRSGAEMIGRFECAPGASAELLDVSRMAEKVLQSLEKVVLQQTVLWRETIDAAHQRWSQLAGTTGAQLEQALTAALARSLQEHALALGNQEQTAAELNRRHWQQLQQTALHQMQAVATQQQELLRQGDVLTQVVQATGVVAKLENELNRNLASLAGAGNLEQTVMTLSAAVQLLTSRLGQVPGERVELRSTRTPKAA